MKRISYFPKKIVIAKQFNMRQIRLKKIFYGITRRSRVYVRSNAASNLSNVFETLNQNWCVLLFDGLCIDIIAKN